MHHLKTLIFAMALANALQFYALATSFAAERPVNRISTSGTGMVSLPPDMAIISFGVERTAKSARDALDDSNQSVARILDALKENGVADKDIQTSGFRIQPRYFYPKAGTENNPRAPEIIGYVVSNNLSVRLRDLTRTGEFLDLVVTLGSNIAGNIRFLNQDTEAVLKEARSKAVKNAIAKARTLTEAAGVELGDILSISENNQTDTIRSPKMLHARAVQEDAGNVPVAGGENTYAISVQITWEIVQ